MITRIKVGCEIKVSAPRRSPPAACGSEAGRTARDWASELSARSHLFYINALYTDLYIYPHSYIFNFFSHFTSFIRRMWESRVCAGPPFQTWSTKRTPGSSIYVFLERVKLLYLSFLLFGLRWTQRSECRTVKYFFSIYEFHFFTRIAYFFVWKLLSISA